jgi:hypothetical protein
MEAHRRVQEETARMAEQAQRVDGELQLLRKQREQWSSDNYGTSASSSASVREVIPETKRREEAAKQRDLDLTFGKRQNSLASSISHMHIRDDRSAEAERKQQEDARRLQQQQQQQEEMRRRGEEITRRRTEERRKAEHDSLAGKQRADERGVPSYPSSSPTAIQHQYRPHQPTTTPTSTVRAPTAVANRPPSFLDSFSQALVMPLESPTRYDGDSTDSEAVGDGLGSVWRNTRMGKYKADSGGTPSRPPGRR